MKSYEKPGVINVTDRSEGVYAASGAVMNDDCWEVSVGTPTTTSAYRHFPLTFIHGTGHEAGNIRVTFVFNQDVDVASVQNVQVIGATISRSGNTVVAEYPKDPPVSPWVNVWATDAALINSIEIISVSAVCAD